MKALSQSADLEFSTPTLSVCICRSSQQLGGHLLIFSTVTGSIDTLSNETLQIKVFFEAGLPPALKYYGSAIKSLPWIWAPMPTVLHITVAAEVVFVHMFSLKWGSFGIPQSFLRTPYVRTGSLQWLLQPLISSPQACFRSRSSKKAESFFQKKETERKHCYCLWFTFLTVVLQALRFCHTASHCYFLQ